MPDRSPQRPPDPHGRPDPAGSAGHQRRARERAATAAAAAAGPSAARWLLHDDGNLVGLDVVARLLGLDVRTRLRGRGDAEVRALAGQVDALVRAGALAPSGRPMLDVLVVDPAERAALEPVFDLDALFADGPIASTSHDRTLRLAQALLRRAADHRAGTVDLYAEVAPVGVPRHPRADEVEALARLAADGVPGVGGPDPAVVVVADGWVATSPAELFVAAARGVLAGQARDVAGAAIASWLGRVRVDAGDPWWLGLTSWLPVDAGALLDGASARAGSDHPEVLGAALVEAIAGRYPLGPPV